MKDDCAVLSKDVEFPSLSKSDAATYCKNLQDEAVILKVEGDSIRRDAYLLRSSTMQKTISSDV